MDTEAIDHSEQQPTRRPNTPCEHENCLRASCECIVSTEWSRMLRNPLYLTPAAFWEQGWVGEKAREAGMLEPKWPCAILGSACHAFMLMF